MIGVLIVTHGRLADELLAAGRVIAGELPGFRALSLDWQDDLETAKRRIDAAIAQLDQGDGVLVLTDMFGDTPSNATLALLDTRQIQMVSGVNLPMVVRLGCSIGSAETLELAARWLEVKGRRSIARTAPRPAAAGTKRERGDG